MIMIIGCVRSGTGYISALFKKNKIDIGHEKIGNQGIASWCLVPDTNLKVWGPSFKELENLKISIVHQVRHPLKAISSIQTTTEESWNFISNFINIKKNDSLILKCMKYWYFWNILAEKKAEYTYRIENIKKEFNNLYKIANFKIDKNVNFSVSKKTNSRKHSKLSWKDLEREDLLLKIKIKDLAKKYGYKNFIY